MHTFHEIWVAENDSVSLEPVGENLKAFFKCVKSGLIFDEELPLKLKNYNSKGKLYNWDGHFRSPIVHQCVKDDLQSILGDAVQWIGPWEFRGYSMCGFKYVLVVDATTPESSHHRIYWNYNVVKDLVMFRPQAFKLQTYVRDDVRDLT